MEKCPFCGNDPFHYVNNGIGYEAVAVNCCALGVELYKGGKVPLKILALRRSYSPRKKARAKRLMEKYV